MTGTLRFAHPTGRSAIPRDPRDPRDLRAEREPGRAGERAAFWIVILASFLTILSAMLLMMTWFGSEWQETLLILHRISSLVLFVAAAYQAWRLLTKSRPAST